MCIGIMLVVCTSCTPAPNLSEVNNLNGNAISVFGHAGMGYTSWLPTNSLASIQQCLDLGADGTEIDIQLTKDGQFVVFHDENLEDATNKTGRVGEMIWKDIQGAEYDGFGHDEEVVLLETLFGKISQPQDYIFTFDCKIFVELTPDYQETFIKELIRIIDTFEMGKYVFIELRHRELLENLKAQKPDYKLFALGDFEWALQLATDLDLFGISVTDKKVTADEVALAHEKGIRVAFYSSNRKANVIEKNPDFIQTDKLKYFLTALSKY